MTPLAVLAALLPSVPSLVKMIGLSDNAANVADIAVGIAKKVTGSDTTEGALSSLQANPELMLAYQTKLMAQADKMEELYISDKASARLRDTELIKAGKPNRRADFLVAFSAVLLLIILGVVTFTDLNEFAKGMFTMLAGFVINQLSNVYGFEFGTTRKEEAANRSILADYISSPASFTKGK